MSARLRTWLPRAAFALVVLVGIAAAVPSPWLVVRPLAPLDARAAIVHPPLPARVRDAGGRLLIPVVDDHRGKWVEAVWYAATGRAQLESTAGDARGAHEHGDLSAAQLQRDAQAIATLVAARAAHVNVVPTGHGVRVMAQGTNPDHSPLRSGDVIVAVDGTPVHTFDDLRAIVERTPAGTRYRVRLAGGRELALPPVPAGLRADGVLATPHALGMAAVETDRPGIAHSPIAWRDLGVTGPSSGLAMALAAYERFTGRALAPGRVVVATGEIGSDAGVYPVGGVPQKAQGARQRHADLLLVATADENVARAHAGDVSVVAVDSFGHALDALARRTTR